MMNIKKIAAEIVEEVYPAVDVASDEKAIEDKVESNVGLGKEVTEEDESGVQKIVGANCCQSNLAIKMLVSPQTIEEAIKISNELEELVSADSEKVPYAMEHSHLKIGGVDINRPFYLQPCDCCLYVCAHISISNGGTEVETDETWGPAAMEVAKKFGYKT